jgi:hypothetical protein
VKRSKVVKRKIKMKKPLAARKFVNDTTPASKAPRIIIIGSHPG